MWWCVLLWVAWACVADGGKACVSDQCGCVECLQALWHSQRTVNGLRRGPGGVETGGNGSLTRGRACPDRRRHFGLLRAHKGGRKGRPGSPAGPTGGGNASLTVGLPAGPRRGHGRRPPHFKRRAIRAPCAQKRVRRLKQHISARFGPVRLERNARDGVFTHEAPRASTCTPSRAPQFLSDAQRERARAWQIQPCKRDLKERSRKRVCCERSCGERALANERATRWPADLAKHASRAVRHAQTR